MCQILPCHKVYETLLQVPRACLWDQAVSGCCACCSLNSPLLYPTDLPTASYHVPHGQKELRPPCHSRMYLVETPVLPVAASTCHMPGSSGSTAGKSRKAGHCIPALGASAPGYMYSPCSSGFTNCQDLGKYLGMIPKPVLQQPLSSAASPTPKHEEI